MKLKPELPYLLDRMQLLDRAKVLAHIDHIKALGDYKDLKTRIANDLLRFCVPVDVICSWYAIYGCNDSHITTLAIKACKELNYL